MVTTTDACAQGGGVQMTVANYVLSPYGSQWQFAGARFTVPSWMPNTRITRIRSTISVAAKTGDDTLSFGRLVTVGESGGWGAEQSIPAGSWPGLAQGRLGSQLGRG